MEFALKQDFAVIQNLNAGFLDLQIKCQLILFIPKSWLFMATYEAISLLLPLFECSA